MVAVAPQDGAGSVFALAPPGDGSWREEALLEASDGADGDAFGSSVSVGDDLALVGAVGESSLGVGAGAAYIFARMPPMAAARVCAGRRQPSFLRPTGFQVHASVTPLRLPGPWRS